MNLTRPGCAIHLEDLFSAASNPDLDLPKLTRLIMDWAARQLHDERPTETATFRYASGYDGVDYITCDYTRPKTDTELRDERVEAARLTSLATKSHAKRAKIAALEAELRRVREEP